MNKNHVTIGFIKNIIVCIYDILLLFSILFFMSLPFVIYFNDESFGSNIFYRLYLMLIIFSYYTYFWINYGQTLGMRSWKVYLINDKQGKITILQCLTRIVAALLGGHLSMLLGFQSILNTISKTRICNKD
tara:strand:- start:173 stop:565 length:393 start_codon:yes stop_codon:yes gene_type:complete